MKLKFIWITFFAFLCISVNAQVSSLSKKAQTQWFSIKNLYSLNRFEIVQPQLEKFVKSNPKFLPAKKNLAELYLKTNQDEKAAEFVNEVLQKGEIDNKNWYLLSAETNERLKKYPEAIQALKKFQEYPKLTLILSQKADAEIARLEFIYDMRQHPVDFEPISLPGEVNTAFDELYPVINPEGNKLFFTRKELNEDMYVAELNDSAWTNAVTLPFNTSGNEGAQTISADGKLILFTACNRRDGLGSCDIYYTVKANGTWTKVSGLGTPINTGDWESQPCIAFNGKVLIFSAIREGGYGAKDLYASYLNRENKWMEPQNLGAIINTKGNEETPFFHPDGRTLYFTSDGHPSIGGKDIFMSKLSDDGIWSTPINLGYPINTESDESGLFVAMDGQHAYFSSNREGGAGKLDIYYFKLPEKVKAGRANYVKAIVKDAVTKKPIQVEYNIYKLSNDSIFTYGQTDNDGSLLVTIPSDETFRMEVDKENYVFYSEQFAAQNGTIQKPYLLEVFLSPIEIGASTILKNVLFKTDSYELESESYPELQKVVEFLQKHPNLKASIIGHTDNVGSTVHNLELSKNRAQAVVDYLINKGIASNRLTVKGVGETRPIADNDSVEGRSQNRRTEFVIVE
ncbi:MAG: OmpA family protein [Chitinophagales bacterium]|nr:OmpA family protein [Chitinophagales bacterium]